MKILLEKNEYILVEECADENVRDTGLGIVSAKLVKVQPMEGKSKAHCECVEVVKAQDVLFRDLLSHLGDISASTEIDLLSFGDDINKFCDNSLYNILVRVACDGKSLRFDIYEDYRKGIIKRGLTLEQLVEFVDEINKRYETTV